MSLLNSALSGLGSGLVSFASDTLKDEEMRRQLPLMNMPKKEEIASAPKPMEEKNAPEEKKLPGPRMPAGVNPYGDNPHAQELWLAERAIVGPESGGRANAQNPVSSAGGLYQITDSTWDSALRGLGLPVAATREDRNAQKYDANLNTRVMRQINTEAAAALDHAGLPVTVETLQAAHRLGPAGAASALRAAIMDPNAPLVGHGLAPDAVRGNGDIARLTVGQFLARPYPGAKGDI